MKTAVKAQVLSPQAVPLIGIKDFPEGDPKPVDQPTLTPATADPFNPIDHPAESRFRDIRRQLKPELMIQPVI